MLRSMTEARGAYPLTRSHAHEDDDSLALRQCVEMARHPLVATVRTKFRLVRPAAVEDVRTTGVEAASTRRVDRAWHVTAENNGIALGAGLGQRDRREQRL